MAQFCHDYPQSPLKGTVEEELVALAESHKKGEPLKVSRPAPAPAPAAVAKQAPEEAEAAASKAAGGVSAEKGAADRAAVEKAASEKAAAGKAAQKAAAAKAEKERLARESAAQKKLAAARKKETPVKREQPEAARRRAIAAYQAVVDQFPGTAAAAGAQAKLQQLRAAAPVQQKPALATAPPQQAEVSQVFDLEVAQYADVEVTLGAAPESWEAGKPFSIPFDIVNTGNGSDSFYLESGFPAEFGFRFAALESPGVPINRTPELAVGEKFRGVAVGTMPRANIDGQKNQYPIKIVSAFAREASQSREIVLLSSAPLLRAVLKSDKEKLLPGEKISYRVSLLNIGTAPARGVTLRVNYPPQYEPVDFRSLGFAQEAKAALVLDSLLLKSGEGKDFNLTFQLKDEALAEQELFLRVDVVNHDLEKKDSFVSGSSVVQRVTGITARTASERLVVVPGQVVTIPVTVTNTGNVREVFAIKTSVAGNASYTFFDDLNRDGNRQAGEPIINHVGPLSPKEEAHLLLEVATPASANDGAVAPVSVFFEPESAPDRPALVNLQLSYSRPILELSMAAQGGRLKPGEVSSLELNCVNRGSNLAKEVVLQSILPAQLELVAAEPTFSKADNGIYLWRFDELGAGEKRNIRVTYRVKPGIAMGTSMQLKNLVNYQDPLGNRY